MLEENAYIKVGRRAYLVSDNWAAGSSSIGSDLKGGHKQLVSLAFERGKMMKMMKMKVGKTRRTHDDAIIEDAANNGCTCGGSLWQGDALGMQSSISVIICEVEASHDGGDDDCDDEMV